MIVQYSDIMSAHQKILQYLDITPTYHYPVLDEFVGARIYIKHENHQPTGAFKIRGGINLLSHMPQEKRQRGLVAASTGNHGQSIARAGEMFGTDVSIFVPVGTNPNKIAAMQKMSATVIEQGERFNDSHGHAVDFAAERGAYFVDNGNELLLIAGVGTVAKEILDATPNLDTIFVPVGSGTLAASTCIVVKTLNPAIRVIAVQSENAPAAHDSWRSGKIETRPNHTIAEGISTGAGFEIPQQILRDKLDDFVLVSDEAIMQAQIWLLDKAHTLTEGAGAAGLAAIYQMRDTLQGQNVGLICSGGNTSRHELGQSLATFEA